VSRQCEQQQLMSLSKKWQTSITALMRERHWNYHRLWCHHS
jgi:hypothetical protein